MGERSSSLFREACEAAGPLQLDYQGADVASGSETLPQTFAVIGRDPRVDLCLPHQEVSLRHAYLQIIMGRVFYTDLGSRTGLQRGGEKSPSGWLDRKDPLEIGPYQLGLGGADHGIRADATGQNPYFSPLEPPTSPHPLATVVLDALNVRSRPSWRMDRMMVLVGSSPVCQVAIPNGGLSRFHCSLLSTSLGVWVVDLLGHDGVHLNGESIRFARLDDGDDLLVGGIVFRIRYVSAVRQMAPPAVSPGAGAMVLVSPAMPPAPRFVSPAEADEPAQGSWLEPISRPERILVDQSADPRIDVVIDQFAQIQHQMMGMQRQMSDQYQQLTMMMLQMFGTMHKDQMGIVIEEFDQIRKLTEELKTLRETAAKSAPVAAAAAPERSTAMPIPNSQPALQFARRFDAEKASPARETARGLRTHPAAAVSAADRNRVPSEPPNRRADAPTDQPAGSAAAAARPSRNPDLHIHDLLTRRVSEIQNERQSRWQRVLTLLTGA
jgi:pSer/pThr/pTyr-binding forkhead associated (FHA) protein